MIDPLVQWTAPAPLWQPYAQAEAAADRAAVRRPHILRFATDTFMDEFIAVLQNDPQRLHEWIVAPETWRGPAAALAPVQELPPLVRRMQRLRLATVEPLSGTTTALISRGEPADNAMPLKLYQPGHMRFYLVTACLVCRLPGLPDRRLDFGGGERVSFVVRRLRPQAGATDLPKAFNLDTCDEYALVNGNRWEKAPADELVPGEEQTSMFGVTYVENDSRKRRLLAAALPVGKRETYMSAVAGHVLPDDDPPKPVDPRKALLMRTVTDPWRSIVEQYDKALDNLQKDSPPDIPKPSSDTEQVNKLKNAELDKVKKAAFDQSVWLSWLTLLDFGDFLAKYVQAVWSVILDPTVEDSLNSNADAKVLYTKLKSATYADSKSGATLSLAQALKDVRGWCTTLENGAVAYSSDDPDPDGLFPNFRFPLHEPVLAGLVQLPEGTTGSTVDDWVVAALPDDRPSQTPPLPLAAALSTLDMREPGWFIIRCIFERPTCVPLTAPLLSEATEPFQMASFFDADAPARPIRINLPLDTSPAGLRKFDRNTAFMISDVLCGQLERMGGITFGDLVLSVLPWPFHKDLPVPEGKPCPEGMICSLSIPIITICALILLIIIVSLLDIIFHWIPFFITCFPLPRFKGKEA